MDLIKEIKYWMLLEWYHTLALAIGFIIVFIIVYEIVLFIVRGSIKRKFLKDKVAKTKNLHNLAPYNNVPIVDDAPEVGEKVNWKNKADSFSEDVEIDNHHEIVNKLFDQDI